MSDIVSKIELENGKRVEFYHSEGDSRTWDNLTKMICFHGRYGLGDKHDYSSNDYSGWDEMKSAIIKNENVAIIKPLFLYDHSGITISTSSFPCRWDSGQVGFVFISKETIKKEYNVKRISKKRLEAAEKLLDCEVETYNKDLTGDVFGFSCFDENGEMTDSCGGFYGGNFEENCMLEYICDEEIAEAMKKEKSI